MWYYPYILSFAAVMCGVAAVFWSRKGIFNCLIAVGHVVASLGLVLIIARVYG
jgi:hypothetical protein